ncbi:MAG TPA: cyclic nucleotide-binding domain-containing protein [Kofleriaceae bacterium]|nr:cyclic nucleotide-binding domain-containing protein [Kofleriaceae bacterium]
MASGRKTRSGVGRLSSAPRKTGRPTLPGRARRTSPRPTAPAPERLVDRGEIARGGMGVIRRVYDTRIERVCALKVIDAQLATHPEALGRFMDEARITGQLDHPNIVPVYDVEVDDAGIPSALLMKLVEGDTLTHRIGPPGTMRSERMLRELLEIFLKICDAVAFAHSRGVIHRDLKPDNVMIGEFGQIYVMDWGCAHVMAPARTRRGKEGAPRRTFTEADGTVIGTPGYMAPEQAWGKTDQLDERTDVFGLGGILYHILTGDAPYPEETSSGAVMAARRGAPMPPKSVPGAPPPPLGLRRIVMRALAAEPAERYESVEELKAEVEGFLRGGSFFMSRTFPAGTIIVREGDPADEAYVLTAGRCEAFRKQRGRRIALRTFGPGDVFGEGALFTTGARNASVIAVDDVTAVVVSREVLHEELALDSWMGSFVRALALRYRDLESRQQVIDHVTEHARVIATIAEHVTRAGAWVRSGVLETQWSRAWATLAPELRLPEPAVLAIVARSGTVAIDPSRDVVTLEMASP